jgi:2-dehydro-3-deoxyphosphogluconate aldolase/(4S)-4-hydroxy-2-oxoglutarate aldolase
MSENLIKLISKERIFPIIRCREADKTVEIAKALFDGGIKIAEINVENPSIYSAISEISSFMHVCAGGIITSLQADYAVRSGAKLISSPIFSMTLVKLSKDIGVPYIAGTSTANEAYSAWKARIPLIKIYPIAALGGAMYLEDLLRPMPFLNILPLGNVKLDEVNSYIDAGAKAVGVGRDFYEGLSLSEITSRAKKVLADLRS